MQNFNIYLDLYNGSGIIDSIVISGGGMSSGVEHEEELIQREFNQMELGKFVQLLLKVQRTLLTNSSILLEEDSPMAKQNQQVQPERIMVWETIIILLDFGSKQLDKEGSPDSGLPNSLYR